MKKDDALFTAAKTVFYLIALVVVWNTLAPGDWRVLSEMAKKFWAMAGLALYALILLENHRRNNEPRDRE